MVEDLPALDEEVAANVARLVAHRVEAGELHGGELGGRAFVEVDPDVDAVGALAGDDVGGDDARVEETARAVVELDAAKVELKRERVEVFSRGQLLLELAFIDVAQPDEREAVHDRALVVDRMSATGRQHDHDEQGGDDDERTAHERRLWPGSAAPSEVNHRADEREDDQNVDRDRPDVKDGEAENPGEEKQQCDRE